VLGAAHIGIDLAALIGAGAAIALVFAIGVRAPGGNVERLLLTGVVIAAGLGAVVSLFLVLAPAAQLHGMLFWLMGDVSRARSPLLPFAVLCVVALVAIWIGPRLNVLALGEIKAKALGLNVGGTQALTYLLAAVATAAAVVTAGSIGFVGLLAPHAVRLAGVADQRRLLPLAALLGGSVLTLADLAARSVAAPIQLPVGALTALLGVPALLILLLRRY
jgi:iron complex transport system permease protein